MQALEGVRLLSPKLKSGLRTLGNSVGRVMQSLQPSLIAQSIKCKNASAIASNIRVKYGRLFFFSFPLMD